MATYIKDWKKEGLLAVTSSTGITNIATATGYPDIAEASAGVTTIVVKGFAPRVSVEEVPERTFQNLRNKVAHLEQTIENATPEAQTHAFKCKADFDRAYIKATTKMEMFTCISAYIACLMHGFEISVNLKG